MGDDGPLADDNQACRLVTLADAVEESASAIDGAFTGAVVTMLATGGKLSPELTQFVEFMPMLRDACLAMVAAINRCQQITGTRGSGDEL